MACLTNPVVIVLVMMLLLPQINTNRLQKGFVLGCHQAEREALSNFKATLTDLTNRLSSWKGDDCCLWHGVTCHNVTRHVLRLDLHLRYDISFESVKDGNLYQLHASNLDPSLLELTQLRYLDLSGNDFNGSRIPEFLGSLKHLRYLNLSMASFDGIVPSQLGNLTTLQVLDLHSHTFFDYLYYSFTMRSLHWVSTLVNLQYLDISHISLDTDTLSSFQALINLPSLLDLRFSNLQIHKAFPTFYNTTFVSPIQHLDLSENYLQGHIPQFLANMSSLRFLDLSSNEMTGSIPLWLRNIRGLEVLDLGWNSLCSVEGGTIMGILGHLCNLKVLDLSFNSILGGEILNRLDNFSECISYDLESLYLGSNNITGTLSYWLGELKNLKVLSLGGGNRFSGPIPTSIQNLSLLEYLDLGGCGLGGENFLEVVVSESHLSELSSLKRLDLSHNSLNINLSSDWIPKFQLSELRMRSCGIRGQFPQWINSQNELMVLDLSNNKIFGRLPEGFTNLKVTDLNLSSNGISGPIPHFSPSSNISSIDLSFNSFSGPLVNSLCYLRYLEIIDLKGNQLFSSIPDCWGNSNDLFVIDLSSNRLSGIIPLTFGQLPMRYLKLNNNSLEGYIPSTFKDFSQLIILDLGENKLSGTVPTWNRDSHPFLTHIRLRGNQLEGIIPPQLCSLSYLHFLDLGINNLTGSIPPCFGHLMNMNPYGNVYGQFIEIISREENAMVVLKGTEQEYTTNLKFVMSLDLSCNGLVGSIPQELTNLTGLIGLNLSYNHLNGSIPEKIGEMVSMESLDLSYNNLSGTIPSSLSTITTLSFLNLSTNKHHGEIPTGSQLQTFNDPSIYGGNAGLCGDPLPTPCHRKHSQQQQQTEDGEEGDESTIEKVMFYIVVMLGFATGFWGVVGSLWYNQTWRHGLFRLVENINDFLYVQLVLRINRLKN